MRIAAIVIVLVLGLGGAAVAGEYYISDYPNYWWYWDGAPDYEVLIPSTAYAYVQMDWAGATSLKIALGEKGPLMIVGTASGTNVNALWDGLSSRWGATVQQARTTTDTTITTDQGLRARFKVLEGRSPGQPTAIVRAVVFTKDGRMAYLAFVGDESDYSGDIRQYWLRAVHSFAWRS